MRKCWLGNSVVNQPTLIYLDNFKIGIGRNPYERVVTLYKEGWDYNGLEQWLKNRKILPQSELYKDCDAVVCLESWERDFDELGMTPDKNTFDKLESKYSSDYRRWYTQSLKDEVDQLAKQDLDTYGYRF